MKAILHIVRRGDRVHMTFRVPARVISAEGARDILVDHTFVFPIEQWEHLIFSQARLLGFNPSVPEPIEA